jgi:hypothetical protein
MMRIRTLAVVSVLVCGCGGDTPQPSAQPSAQPGEAKPEESRALLDAARERLGKLGYQPAASVVLEQRTAKEVIRDFDAQQDLLLPPATFPVQHALFTGLGIRAGQTPADLREQSVAAMVRGVSAYYDPVHKAFVLLPTLTRQMAEALAGGAAPLITHELVHACHDAREGGLAGWFDATNRTLDEANARRIVVEGEAELVAVLALAGEPGVQMLEGDEAENALESVLAGEFTARVYSAGRRLMRERYTAGGLEAVRALWQRPPRVERAGDAREQTRARRADGRRGAGDRGAACGTRDDPRRVRDPQRAAPAEGRPARRADRGGGLGRRSLRRVRARRCGGRGGRLAHGLGS